MFVNELRIGPHILFLCSFHFKIHIVIMKPCLVDIPGVVVAGSISIRASQSETRTWNHRKLTGLLISPNKMPPKKWMTKRVVENSSRTCQPNLQHHFLLQLCRKASAAQGIHQPRGSRGDSVKSPVFFHYMATV